MGNSKISNVVSQWYMWKPSKGANFRQGRGRNVAQKLNQTHHESRQIFYFRKAKLKGKDVRRGHGLGRVERD